jgi:16S rRNA C967 or C1407 C5-methylase (RsmB/RsmF family)
MLRGEVVAVEINEAARASSRRTCAARRDERRVVDADATALPPELDGFDRALVDAPCSGLGVLARRPTCAGARRRCPSSSSRCCAPAAERVSRRHVVYSVCTLNADENERSSTRPGSRSTDARRRVAAVPHPRRPEFLLTLPHVHGRAASSSRGSALIGRNSLNP